MKLPTKKEMENMNDFKKKQLLKKLENIAFYLIEQMSCEDCSNITCFTCNNRRNFKRKKEK